MSGIEEKSEHVAGEALRRRARALIPGGCHTYAKGDDQYPAAAPPFLARGRGCRVWDADGNQYIEYGAGLRSVTLGHARPEVVAAAQAALKHGSNFIRPAPIEVEYAEALLEHFPPDYMVKFCKNGSDATTAAVKLARAATGREVIAVCRDQPFFSTDDWFIGTTPMSAGIPDEQRRLTVRFPYGDLTALDALFDEHDDRIAAVVMEAASYAEPPPGYLEGVQALCQSRGALFVLDEMITGFRWDLPGAISAYDLQPDLAAFGKGLANGFAVSALVGKREYMRLGGLDHDQRRVFLLSTTHGGETHELAAALAVLRIYENEPIIETLHESGRQLQEGANGIAAELGINDHWQVTGRPCNQIYVCQDRTGERSQAYRTLFMQELIRRGVIGPSFVVNAAHDRTAIDQTLQAIEGALQVYRQALEQGVQGLLIGPPSKPVFREFN